MTEETSPNPQPPENPASMESWEDEATPKKDPITILSWTLAAIGIAGILCAIVVRLATHRLYPELLAGGLSAYVMGRVIMYYRRFRKKQSRQ